MSTDIPNDYGSQVQQLIAQGKFQDEQAVVNEGIRLVIARETLHADIQAGIDQLDRGEGVDAEDVYAEARRRIKAIEEQQ
jgi:Arc/MetJ-type ribon-helix-helix transcriptional regulator